MSRLRPECGNSSGRAIPDDTALFLIRDAVARRRSLIHGRLIVSLQVRGQAMTDEKGQNNELFS